MYERTKVNTERSMKMSLDKFAQTNSCGGRKGRKYDKETKEKKNDVHTRPGSDKR